MNRQQVIEEIKSRLEKNLSPSHLEIIDDSKKHAKHEEAKKHPKAGHYNLIIASDKLRDLKLLDQHKEIKNVLKDMIPNFIHALSIKVLKQPSKTTIK